MSAPKWFRTGPLFAISLFALAGLLVADASIADGGQRSVATYRTVVQNDRAVLIGHVEATQGDVLRAYYERDVGDPYGTYEFYVVEGGEGDRFVNRQAPLHVYFHADGMEAGAWEGRDPVFLRRSTPPVGGDPAALDLVWILEFKEGTDRPASGENRRYFDEWAKSQVGHVATPFVSERGAVRFHAFSVTLMYVLGGAGLLFGALWVRSLARAPRPEQRLEASASLVDLGGENLRIMRSMLFAVGLPLLLFGFLWRGNFLYVLSDVSGPSSDWMEQIKLGVDFVLFLSFASWAVVTARTEWAYRRWRRFMAERPLST